MKFYWFGDSWVFGAELEKILPDSSWKKSAFPQIVSDLYGAECVNLGVNGNGPDSLIWDFSKVANDIDPDRDRVFFFLSADNRTRMFDERGRLSWIGFYPGHIPADAHPHWKQYLKYFDNAHQRTYNYDRSVNLLYFWCKSLGIRCYLSNIFTTQPTPMMDNTDPGCWLLPRDQCIATAILPCVDNSGDPLVNDVPTLSNEQWKLQQPYVEKYIRPCFCHPNVEGHKKIAQTIIELIEKNNQ